MIDLGARHAVHPMRRALVSLGVLLLIGVGVAAPADARPTDRSPVRRVVIISVPTLTWQTVADARPPAIMRLLGRSAVASLSVRTIGPRTTLAEGYATLGAGNRATARPDAANQAFGPEDHLEESTAAEVYQRRTGREPAGAVLQVAIVDILRSASRLKYGAEPGSFGDALGQGRKSAAVIANGDTPGLGASDLRREAALALMDSNGIVAGGTVGAMLTRADPSWPFGVRTDEPAVDEALHSAIDEHDVVLVEASDMARLDRYRPMLTDAAGTAADARALAAADRLVGHVLERVDLTKDLVVFLSPVAPMASEHLTTFAIAGPGFAPGSARSATTRRAGFVTLPDVAPTVLHALGLAVPTAMAGTLISSEGNGPPTDSDLSSLARSDEIARFRDQAVGPVSVAFIVFQVLVYGFAVVAVTGRRDRLRPYVGAAALGVLAMPPVVFLSGLVRYDRLGVVGYTIAVFGASAVLAALAWVIGRRWTLLAPGLLVGTTLAVLLLDVVLGAPLQINTPFGYSPIVAGRFAGYGNLAFALLAMAAIVLGTMVWAAPRVGRPERSAGGLPLLATVALFLVVLVVDGLPNLGSDVGGVLATLPAFAVTVLLLARVRISWPRVVAIGVASLAAVAGFAAVDLSRPEEQRTHLGRFARRLLDGDIGTTLQRKAEANLSLLTSSVWTYVIPVALAFLAFLTWRKSGFLRELQRSVPGLRPCLIGGLVAGVLGFALNDSGVAVPAMMFGILLPYLTWLLMGHQEATPGGRPHDGPTTGRGPLDPTT